MAKLIGSHAVSGLIESLPCGRCGIVCSDEFPNGCACECHPTVTDLSGPIELDPSGVPVIPMDIDERRWLNGGE